MVNLAPDNSRWVDPRFKVDPIVGEACASNSKIVSDREVHHSLPIIGRSFMARIRTYVITQVSFPSSSIKVTDYKPDIVLRYRSHQII